MLCRLSERSLSHRYAIESRTLKFIARTVCTIRKHWIYCDIIYTSRIINLIDQEETETLLILAKNFLDKKYESISRGDIKGAKVAEQFFELTLTELLRKLGMIHLILRKHSGIGFNSFTLQKLLKVLNSSALPRSFW